MANTANIQSLSISEIQGVLANSIANSTLTTDFNVTPYYDDYSSDKNFYRILYRPGYAVQGRELTQSQTILQKQINRFGQHVFREGSIVIPGQFGIEQNLDYIKIRDIDNSNNDVDVAQYVNETFVGQTNGVKAFVIEVGDGAESTSSPKTLFLRYTAGGSSNGAIRTFANGEILISESGALTAIAASSDATGKGSRFVITEGVVFAKEHFVSFPTSSVILSRYTTNPNCRVGFNITEDIVTAEEDISLLDPALESSNYSAPGADRFRMTPELQVLALDDPAGRPNFVEMFTIEDGIITERYERPQYNILGTELAKRTYDESGDYYVNGFNVRLRENKDTGINFGYSVNGSSSLLSVGVEPGVAYVKGYEVSLEEGKTYYITTPKSNTYQNVSSQSSTAVMGDYVVVNEFTGSIDLDEGKVILLQDAASKRLTNRLWASSSAVGNTIGTAKVFAVEYNSGSLGAPSGNVNVYLADIKMNGTNSFASVKSLAATNFGGDLVLDSSGNAALKESLNRHLLYFTGTQYARTLKDSSGIGSVNYLYNKTTAETITSAGTITVAVSPDVFSYGTVSDLSDADRRDIIVSIDSDANIAGSGTVSGTGGSNTLTSSGSVFNRLNVGDKIEINGKSNTFFVETIAGSGATITVTPAIPAGISGNTWYKAYKNGDIIDLTTKGFDAGAERSVSTTPTQLSIDLKETFGGSGYNSKITYQLYKTNSSGASKTLRDNRYVSINCTSAGTSGSYNLGFSDVYKIRKIVKKTGSIPASLNDGTDVTSFFSLDNGQRDTHYELASIASSGLSIGGTDCLLISLDYFEPQQSEGFFCIDSYPVDDANTTNTTIKTENIPVYTSLTNGSRYDLRNYIDYRPVKSITAASATTPGTATVNPANSDTFIFGAGGIKLIAPSTQLTYDYSYYEARRDLVIIDKDKNVSIIKSNPGQSPITPVTPENTMAIASIFVMPYPSLAPNYAQIINRRELACVVKKLANVRHTMKDIGVLKRRIENLEYYASLNLLEKAAIDLKVLDENGLDRFKNGIFVDSFADHLLGDRRNADYRITIDPFEKSLHTMFTQTSHYYDYLASDGATSGVVKTGDLVTLPYTANVLINQSKVTSYRNVELTSYRFIGNMFLNPETDVWVDIKQAPDEQVSIGPNANNLPQGSLSTTWNSWQTSVTGYHIDGSTSSFGDKYVAQDFTTEQFNNLSKYIQPGKKGFLGVIASPNSPADQKITEYSTTVRTGTETYVADVTATTETIGSKLLDVSLIPYIRPQQIYIASVGVKANTKFYTFFDGEDMSSYVTQIQSYNYNPSSNTYSSVSNSQPPGLIVKTKAEGDDLISNANGECFFVLRLPEEKKFRVGTKEVIITDSPTNSTVDASSSSTAYFVAQGLLQQKQDTVLTTRQVITAERSLTENTRGSKVVGYIDRPSCSAYSFIPKAPDGEEGIFLTGLDLYFAKKHPTLGVWIEIRQMDSAGGITRNQIPLSEVWKNASELNVSDDASEKTYFGFRSPIFLYNNVQYAVVIHTVGLNPDTYLWISRLGETDIKTGNQVNSRPLTGTFYTTNNNLNWDIVPDVDLMCTLYRAKFTTGSGTAVIGNRPTEKLVLGNVSSTFNNYGERIFGRTRLTLTGANTSYINVGDYLVGATSGANSAVISNSSPYIVSNIYYTTGETVRILNPATGAERGNVLLSSVALASGILGSYTVKDGVSTLEILNSNGAFYVTDTIRGNDSGATATVDGIQNIRYSVIDFEPSHLQFNKTAISFTMAAASNAGVAGTYSPINDSSNYYYDVEKAILSRSNEITSLSGDRSNKVKVAMFTSTEYMSPVLDVSRTHSVYVDNYVNANTSGETGSSGGQLLNKYISKVVTLAEGQDAEDLNVILTAYRPPATDVEVYAKIVQGEDSDFIGNVNWIQMEKVDNSAFSSLSNRSDFKEFTFKFPDSKLTGALGEVQYTNSKGVVFTGFKYYQIKIGLIAANSAVSGASSAIVPRVGDLRAIALQI